MTNIPFLVINSYSQRFSNYTFNFGKKKDFSINYITKGGDTLVTVSNYDNDVLKFSLTQSLRDINLIDSHRYLKYIRNNYEKLDNITNLVDTFSINKNGDVLTYVKIQMIKETALKEQILLNNKYYDRFLYNPFIGGIILPGYWSFKNIVYYVGNTKYEISDRVKVIEYEDKNYKIMKYFWELMPTQKYDAVKLDNWYSNLQLNEYRNLDLKPSSGVYWFLSVPDGLIVRYHSNGIIKYISKLENNDVYKILLEVMGIPSVVDVKTTYVFNTDGRRLLTLNEYKSQHSNMKREDYTAYLEQKKIH